MSENKLDKTIVMLELIAKILIPLGADVVKELGRLKELRDSDRELTEQDWAESDERFEAAMASLESLLGEG